MTKTHHIMTKARHMMTKAPHITTKVRHIMTKAHHIMTKAHRIRTKAHHIMLKAHRYIILCHDKTVQTFYSSNFFLPGACIILCRSLAGYTKTFGNRSNSCWFNFKINHNAGSLQKGYTWPTRQWSRSWAPSGVCWFSFVCDPVTMTTLFESNHKQRHRQMLKSHQRNGGPWNIQSSHLSVKKNNKRKADNWGLVSR